VEFRKRNGRKEKWKAKEGEYIENERSEEEEQS
jgi:hypothetical protein